MRVAESVGCRAVRDMRAYMGLVDGSLIGGESVDGGMLLLVFIVKLD